MQKTEPQACPCGSKKTYETCCAPLHLGMQKAKTAEQLLRARYSAFVVHKMDYVFSTHHSRTSGEINQEEAIAWSKNSHWHGLEILQVEGGSEGETSGKIYFRARFQPHDRNKVLDHAELAEFEKENGEWKFLDAQGVKGATIVREGPKLGRNDPCHCGSGKKLKKCHGTNGVPAAN